MRNFEQLPPIPAGERQGEKKEELTPEELEGMEKIGPEEELTDEDLRFMKAIGPEEQPDLTEKELGEMEPILARENLTPEGLTEEIGNKPEKEKRSLFKGICNLGFITQELKSKFFAKALEGAGKIVDTDKGKQVQEKNTAARFFHAYSEIYKKQAKQSRDQIESGGKGFLSKSFKGGKNIGYLTGNIFRYGRILYDLNYANPFRHVMIASMFLGRSSEAAKEARFKNEKLIGKTRIEDAEKAEEEAWAIYEQAKEKGGDKVSAENLEKTYNKNISKDVLDRLAKKPEGVSHNIVQGFANRCLEWSAKRMNDKIEKINNSEIPEKEKEAKIDRIIKRKENLLKDLDRMVTQAGTVDLIAFGARGLEKTGKAVSTAMLIQTIYKLPEMLSNIAKTIEDDDRDIGKIVSGFFVSRAEAAETETGILSPDEKIAEAVGKAKGIQGLKQMVAEKFGLNVEDLKDVTGDKDVGDVDIAQIQSGKLGIPAISEPLSAENFRMAQELQEKAPSLIGKIFTDGKISEVESNILKSGWPDNIRLALLDDPADFANIQKIAESNPEIFKGLSEITEKQEIVNMAQIPKGGNISEVLGKAMAKDAAITIINPDGTKILNFDANLVHPGDTVIETGDGEICVLKTSGIEVEEGMSLEGIYDKIQGNLDKEGVPQEVQDYFNTNRAQGGWLGRINREEAENASEFWKKYSQKINELPPEQRGEFYEHTDFNKPEGVESKLDLLKKEAGIRRGEMEEEARKIWGEGKTPEEELLEKKPPVAPVGPGAGIKAPEGEIESYYPRGPKPGVPPTPGEVPLAKTPSEFREFRLPTYAEVIRTGLGGENINVPELNELYEAGKLTDSNIELIDRTSAQISLMRQELGNLDSTDSESIKHLSRLIEEKITGLRSTYGQSILKDNFTIFHPETFEDRARLLFTLKDLAGTRFHHLPVRFEPIEGMPGATSSHLIDNMVLSDIQKNLAGKENFNPSVLKKIIGDSSILLDEKERLEQHSRIISEFSYELTQHPLPDREKFILEEIREIVSADNEVYDPKVYGGNLFKKEVLELLESKPGVPPTPGIEETPPIRPGAEMPKEGVSHPEETPARTEAQAKERVGTEAGTPKGVPHPGETPVVTETEISAGEDIKQLMPEKSRSRGDAHDKIVNFFENKKPQEGLFDQAKQEATNRSIKFVPCGEPTANLDQSLVDEIDRYNANVTAYDNTVIESSKLSGELTDFNNNAAAQEGLASFKKISAEGMGGEKFKNIEWDEEVNDIYRNSPAGYDMNKIPVYDYQTIDHDQKSTLIYEALKIDRDSLVDKMKAEFRGEDIFDKKGEFKKDFLDLAGKNEEAKSLLNEYNDKSKAAAEYEKLAELHDKQETLRTNLMDNTKSIFETADKQDTETLTQEFITNNFSGKQEIRDGFTRIMKKEFKIKDVHSRNSIFNNLIWQNKPIAKYYLTEMNKGTEGQALERIKDYFRLVMERNSSIIKDKDIGDRLKAYVSHYPFYPDAPYETLLEKK